MKSDSKYELLIIGGGISACVFASKYLQNNITKKVALIEIGRGLGGRSSTRISKKHKGWKLNHGSPNLNISNNKNNLLLKKLNICLQISRRSKIPRKKMKNFNIYIFGKPPLSFEASFKLYDLVKYSNPFTNNK